VALRSFRQEICSSFLPRLLIVSDSQDLKEALMEWVTPDHEEIELNCEISSYANAEL